MRFDPNDPPESVEFNGVTYRLMGGARKYYLSQSPTNAGRCRAKGLHVAVWEHGSGELVPKGHEVHHRDSDTFNFDHQNLECLERSVHRRLPRKNSRSEKVLANLAAIRPLASAWHKSPEGRAWHRENTAKSLELSRVARDYVCAECHVVFSAKQPRARFCDRNCAAAFYWRRDHPPVGAVSCVQCGVIFQSKVGARAKFCSPRCKNKHNEIRRGAGLQSHG